VLSPSQLDDARFDRLDAQVAAKLNCSVPSETTRPTNPFGICYFNAVVRSLMALPFVRERAFQNRDRNRLIRENVILPMLQSTRTSHEHQSALQRSLEALRKTPVLSRQERREFSIMGLLSRMNHLFSVIPVNESSARLQRRSTKDGFDIISVSNAFVTEGSVLVLPGDRIVTVGGCNSFDVGARFEHGALNVMRVDDDASQARNIALDGWLRFPNQAATSQVVNRRGQGQEFELSIPLVTFEKTQTAGSPVHVQVEVGATSFRISSRDWSAAGDAVECSVLSQIDLLRTFLEDAVLRTMIMIRDDYTDLAVDEEVEFTHAMIQHLYNNIDTSTGQQLTFGGHQSTLLSLYHYGTPYYLRNVSDDSFTVVSSADSVVEDVIVDSSGTAHVLAAIDLTVSSSSGSHSSHAISIVRYLTNDLMSQFNPYDRQELYQRLLEDLPCYYVLDQTLSFPLLKSAESSLSLLRTIAKEKYVSLVYIPVQNFQTTYLSTASGPAGYRTYSLRIAHPAVDIPLALHDVHYDEYYDISDYNNSFQLSAGSNYDVVAAAQHDVTFASFTMPTQSSILMIANSLKPEDAKLLTAKLDRRDPKKVLEYDVDASVDKDRYEAAFEAFLTYTMAIQQRYDVQYSLTSLPGTHFGVQLSRDVNALMGLRKFLTSESIAAVLGLLQSLATMPASSSPSRFLAACMAAQHVVSQTLIQAETSFRFQIVGTSDARAVSVVDPEHFVFLATVNERGEFTVVFGTAPAVGEKIICFIDESHVVFTVSESLDIDGRRVVRVMENVPYGRRRSPVICHRYMDLVNSEFVKDADGSSLGAVRDFFAFQLDCSYSSPDKIFTSFETSPPVGTVLFGILSNNQIFKLTVDSVSRTNSREFRVKEFYRGESQTNVRFYGVRILFERNDEETFEATLDEASGEFTVTQGPVPAVGSQFSCDVGDRFVAYSVASVTASDPPRFRIDGSFHDRAVASDAYSFTLLRVPVKARLNVRLDLSSIGYLHSRQDEVGLVNLLCADDRARSHVSRWASLPRHLIETVAFSTLPGFVPQLNEYVFKATVSDKQIFTLTTYMDEVLFPQANLWCQLGAVRRHVTVESVKNNTFQVYDPLPGQQRNAIEFFLQPSSSLQFLHFQMSNERNYYNFSPLWNELVYVFPPQRRAIRISLTGDLSLQDLVRIAVWSHPCFLHCGAQKVGATTTRLSILLALLRAGNELRARAPSLRLPDEYNIFTNGAFDLNSDAGCVEFMDYMMAHADDVLGMSLLSDRQALQVSHQYDYIFGAAFVEFRGVSTGSSSSSSAGAIRSTPRPSSSSLAINTTPRAAYLARRAAALPAPIRLQYGEEKTPQQPQTQKTESKGQEYDEDETFGGGGGARRRALSGAQRRAPAKKV